MKKKKSEEVDTNSEVISPYIKSLDECVVHPEIREFLKVRIQAANRRKEELGHILLCGRSDKEMLDLAKSIAKELHSSIKVTDAKDIERTGDLGAIFGSLEAGDVLLIRNIHLLPKHIVNVLNDALDLFIDILVGNGASLRSIHLDLLPFTLVCTLIDYEKLNITLKNRFETIIKFDRYYGLNDLVQVINLYTEELNIVFDIEVTTEIARRSRGNPSISNRLIKCIRDYADVYNNGVFDLEFTNKVLNKLNTNVYGLTPLDKRYLSGIYELHNGGPINIDVLANSIHSNPQILQNECEEHLQHIGFIQFTSRGRIITEKAREYLRTIYEDSLLNLSDR